jgi:hypothetical protein
VQCQHYILNASTTGVLDILDFTFQTMLTELAPLEDYQRRELGVYHLLPPHEAIRRLNHYLQEHSLGYEFIAGQLVRKDSQFMHAEVVEPAIRLMHEQGFRGPSDEFLKAHEHYRRGEYKEAMNYALKSVESTLKTICVKCKWTPSPNSAAKDLIKTVIDNGLIDKSFESSFGALRSVMEGIATARNKNSGHGQGETPLIVPDYLASYALHMAAANIVFLVEAYKARP